MTSSPQPSGHERRSNVLLRMLVNEMLGNVRELQRNAGAWPAEERAEAEVELARIMAQVREAAATRDSAKDSA